MSDPFDEMSDKYSKPKPCSQPGSPTQRDTVIEMVAHRLESLVRSGQLGRGSRLPSEPRLAEMLGISRASLREALKGLVFLGLLKSRPGDGTYLQPSLSSMVSGHFRWMLLLQEIKYLELYELRQILEPAAAALAARRATPADCERMRAALAVMRASVQDAEQFVQAEIQFHDAITQASDNTAIQNTMRMMYDALAEGRHRVLPLVSSLEEHCAHHERIYKLIAGGEATAARRAVAQDLKLAESLLRSQISIEEDRDTHTRTPASTSMSPLRRPKSRRPVRSSPPAKPRK
jgi:GntR family transcriptional repressor for pyruvate dehydrogenase complex